MKRREVKSKGEKKRYTHLNVVFQRIAKRGKKVFLSDQCKEIEGNNRMEKTRDLFKKIRATKGNISCKVKVVKLTQSCPTLRDPMDYTIYGSLRPEYWSG